MTSASHREKFGDTHHHGAGERGELIVVRKFVSSGDRVICEESNQVECRFGRRAPPLSLSFHLLMDADDIAPLFHGASWAGSRIWDAALLTARLLVRWAAQSGACGSEGGGSLEGFAPFKGIRCVELGCGVGFPGMLAAHLGAQTVLTDTAELQSLLHRNVEGNRPETMLEKQSKVGAAPKSPLSKFSCVSRELSWSSEAAGTLLKEWPFEDDVQLDTAAEGMESQDSEVILESGVDLIICCDCVYEPLYGQSWTALIETILVLLGVPSRGEREEGEGSLPGRANQERVGRKEGDEPGMPSEEDLDDGERTREKRAVPSQNKEDDRPSSSSDSLPLAVECLSEAEEEEIRNHLVSFRGPQSSRGGGNSGGGIAVVAVERRNNDGISSFIQRLSALGGSSLKVRKLPFVPSELFWRVREEQGPGGAEEEESGALRVERGKEKAACDDETSRVVPEGPVCVPAELLREPPRCAQVEGRVINESLLEKERPSGPFDVVHPENLEVFIVKALVWLHQ
uniref:Uncharacterized protein n=1 Tax=Chromera velia CCMP2878 TaxID=1169474 RepID=A0A0K6S8K6_9ALVE|eukprot:Cvel_5616.t1-p1 / transcript=Cvel_5616.t1 / gene=Cvel_5616 / organism=Chromera_velia_CCMP2878 / gene_product=Protein-lysine methyltransferase C42C1.13, putative / transcript_product=Protein-lysine methyltransferase C42C1.13, putative / location=Cvel_scaffold264:80783-84327(-) / protein_length=512 / sequence_SO=supercontig / SO=protein_coding / is_pseudo=false